MLLMIYMMKIYTWTTASIYTNTALFSRGTNCLVDRGASLVCTVGYLFIFNRQLEVAFTFDADIKWKFVVPNCFVKIYLARKFYFCFKIYLDCKYMNLTGTQGYLDQQPRMIVCTSNPGMTWMCKHRIKMLWIPRCSSTKRISSSHPFLLISYYYNAKQIVLFGNFIFVACNIKCSHLLSFQDFLKKIVHGNKESVSTGSDTLLKGTN